MNHERLRRIMKYIILILATGLITLLMTKDLYSAVIISCVVGTVYVLLDMHMPTAIVAP